MKKLIIAIVLWMPFVVQGQELRDTNQVQWRNTIKWNMTPMLLFGAKNIVFSYERLLNDDQSFSINAGYISLPEFGNDSTVILRNIERTNSSGFTFSGDYRFYLKRNKYAAPDGIYWGPFFNFYHYNTDFSADYYESGVYQATGELQTQINVAYVGVQLGYQFIIADRYSVDLILFGPAFGMYNASFSATGDIVPQGELQNVIDFLKNQYPVIRDLANTGNADGTGTSWGAGFRYALKVGYRF